MMKRFLVCLVLALSLVFAIGGAVYASPPTAGEAGQFVLFGDYACDAYMYPGDQGFVVGAGYNFVDGFCLGAEAMFLPGWQLYGGFANLTLDPLAFNLDVLFNDMGKPFVKVAGMYLIGLDPVTLGLGGGMVFEHGDTTFIAEGTLNIAATDNFSLYGTVDYNVGYDWIVFKVGASLEL